MKKVISLKTQFVVFFAIFIVALSAIITIMALRESMAVASSVFIDQGTTITDKAAALIDGDSFERLTKTLDANDPFYEEVRLKLFAIKEDTVAEFLYTMAPAEGSIYRYIIDGSAPPTDAENFTPLGFEEDTTSYDPAFERTWRTELAQSSGMTQQAEWGWMISTYAPILNSRGDMVGIVGCDFEAESLIEMIETQTLRQIILAVVLSAIGIVITIVFMGRIFRRLAAVSAILKEISEGEGDLTRRITIKRMDEIGTLASFFNQTLDKIRNMIVAIKEHSIKLSDIGSELASNMTETAAAINQITANIQSIKGQAINQSASVTETGSTMEQVTINIEKLSGQVEEQTGSVAQSSSAIEEMLANIQSVTATLKRNAENVEELTAASEVGRTGLQGVSADIQEIARESEGLLEINSVMQNIASQTNLLSMNAAIEAAHAGEAGRGFAVVADEIRKLAENSGRQSKIISDTLKKIKDAIDKITKSTNTVLDRFGAIDAAVKTVSDQEAQIRNAMEEQGQGSKQILDAIAKLNDITQQVKQGSQEMFTGSKEVINESRNLETVTQEITNGVNEMATGADQINIAINRVNTISGDNKEHINTLTAELARFKVE
ncbi:methyl-accepting chemotaxis protein [Treponema primitia]|uniref:methyl-accepting chemotaxis protein n=1 Tax=Treponema primitia TaxID=88058 RepID=UPI00025553F0|nr:methyl-accepting chemotaxis protein [Treponema primitia]